MTPPSPSPQSSATVHVLRVTLADITPKLWRQLAVPSDLTLAELHEVLQLSFGWYNSHLYQFVLKSKSGVRYASDPMFDLDEGQNAHDLRLGEACAKPQSQLIYEYDIEDQWVHQIEVLSIGTPVVGATYPACQSGARNGPMEDCGGAPGHMELTEALADPDDADPEMLDWAGDYDPESFDLRAINQPLKDWSIERQRQIKDGILWRRSSLLWELSEIAPQHRGPAKAQVAGKLAPPDSSASPKKN